MKRHTNPRIVTHKPAGAAATLALLKAIASSVATNKVIFPTPNPSLAKLDSDITALDVAETTAKSRAKGAAQLRDAKLAVVDTDLQLLQSYVQSTADVADPANATAIAHAAGMDVRKPPTFTKSDFSAKPHKTLSGVIVVTVRATSKREAHDWQFSTDDGKTWVDLPSTLQAKTTASGFKPAQTVHFRHRSLTRGGQSDWCQPISVVAW